jgi:hypothetical protein
MTCPAITAKSSMSFKASSSLQVTAKPSSATSNSARGYRDFKILRVRLTDYLILVRIISRDLVGRLSSIWGACFKGGLAWVEEGYHVVHHCLQGVELGIQFCKPKQGQSDSISRVIKCSKAAKGTYFLAFGSAGHFASCSLHSSRWCALRRVP